MAAKDEKKKKKEMRVYTPEERSKIIKQVEELNQTMPVRDACAKVGIHLTSFYAWKREASGLPRRGNTDGTPSRRAKLQLLNIPIEDSEESVTFFHGKPSAINQVLSRLGVKGA